MRPGPVARGKFLAAYTAIAMYIVMLAPVGAMPFLFGGVTATEVIVAFVFLFLLAVLSVAFGLAISSKLGSLRVAIVLTLLLAFPFASFAFSTFGVGLSVAVHKLWPAIEDGPPVWLPIAYERAPFGVEYVVYLFVLPIVAIGIPAWFLYEVTIANLASWTDDRSSGLKRWFLVSTPILTTTGVVPIMAMSNYDRWIGAIGSLSALAVHLAFCVFLFQGDPIGPSRRVTTRWDREKVGRFGRFMGPGILSTMGLVLVVGLLSFIALAIFAIFVEEKMRGIYGTSGKHVAQIAAFAVYAVGFFVFLTGVGAWLRARSAIPMTSRVLLFAILFGVSVGPWIVAAIAGIFGNGSRSEALVVASPSPFFAFMVVNALDDYEPVHTLVTAGIGCAIGWCLVGFLLLAATRGRAKRIIRDHEELLAIAERILAEEDAAAAAAAAPPEAPPVETAAAITG
jgi:hypothetical protein